jgi:hypothetical protein
MEYRVLISAAKENIIVERQIKIRDDQWQTVDRYTTTNPATVPGKRKDSWILAVAQMSATNCPEKIA